MGSLTKIMEKDENFNNNHENDLKNNNNNKKVASKFTHEGPYLSIPEFYSNKSVFITGATGFLGKILIEKLLRSCPNISKIYLLMRPKKEQKMHERLNEILQAPLFNKLRETQPEILSKVIAVGGDIQAHELGISEDDQKVLIQNVSVIFHAAATVRFNEKIREAVDINVKGTQRVMDLGRKIVDLKAFVYVSTAFSNCNRTLVEEKFYDLPYNSQAIINMTENFSDDFLDKCEPTLLGKWPNTYTFTKSISEDLVKNEKAFPVSIVRPSIVLSTSKEPIPGWVDSFFGPTAIIAANGKGIFHTMLCDPDIVVDLVPADLVINTIVAAGWNTALTKSSEIPIFNTTTSIKNPITWGGFIYKICEYVEEFPFEGVLWYPTRAIQPNRIIHKIRAALFHYLPAYIIDGLSLLSGNKPMMVKIQDKLAAANEQLEFFKLTEIKFPGENMDKLQNTMSKEDASNFSIDATEIDWNQHSLDYLLGIREYAFKQNPATIRECRSKLRKLKILHYTLKTIATLWILKFILFDLGVYELVLKMLFWFIPAV